MGEAALLWIGFFEKLFFREQTRLVTSFFVLKVLEVVGWEQLVLHIRRSSFSSEDASIEHDAQHDQDARDSEDEGDGNDP